MINRTCLILGFSVLTSVVRLGALDARAAGIEAKQANLKVGVCSDLHLGPWNKGLYFERACQWWKREEIDVLILAGDIADCGDLESCGYVRDVLQRVFGSRWPALLITWGNHDFGGDEEKLLTPKNRARILKEWFRIDEAGEAKTYLRKIKGYTFVGSHWQGNEGVQDLDAFLAAHKEDVQGPKPFFYVQHPHVRGTCHGSWVWGQDDGKSTAALAHYPNAICFSGHSHTPLTDERSVWKGSFISIGTAALSNMSLPPGRENTSGVRDAQMPKLESGWGHHALLVTLFEDTLLIERREFQFEDEGAPLGDDWVVPLGMGEWSFEARAKRSLPPAFSAGAQLTVVRRKGRPRDEKKPETDQWVVTFPTAPAHAGRPRALEYEVAAVCNVADFERRVVKRVMSEWFFLTAARDPKASCVFAEDELPLKVNAGTMGGASTGDVRFEVRPVSPFGLFGERLVSATYRR